MSIIQAMYAGSSALNSFGESMTVIGNNLANANTTAFKASSASFEDVLIQTVGNNGSGAATQVGTGVGLADVQQDVTQGSFTNTTNVTDLSIDGRGFFVVKSFATDGKINDAGKPRDIFYTRAGDFKKDKTGDLVNPAGMVLQGWELTVDGEQIPTRSNINLTKFVNADPVPTGLVSIGANLDSSVQALSLNTEYSADDPATYDFSTSVRVFDSRGDGHNVDIQFRKLPMLTPATAIGGAGITSAKQGAGSLIATEASQFINLNLDKDIQVNLIFTPIVNGEPGQPIEADPYFITADNPVVDTNGVTVGENYLVLEPGTVYNVSYTTTKQEIGFDLSETADVTLVFTPVNGNESIRSGTLPLLKKGHHNVDLLKITDDTGMPLPLLKDARYTISYETAPATTATNRVLSNLVGDDSREEILGAENVNNDNTWEWHAVVQSKELELAQQGAGDLTALNFSTTKPEGAAYTAGRLVFDNQGKLLEEGSTPLSFLFKGTEEAQEILFDFGEATGKNGDSTNDFTKKSTEKVYGEGRLVEESGENGGSGSIQVAGGFATTKLEQNGFPSGFIDKLSVGQTGIISGTYTNGQSKQLFQIALVDFDDEAALEQRGGNLFAETISSGLPREGTPQSGRLGSIVAYSLEQSNVDMSGEFVRMITTQRGFQANSRIITVADGMMEELLALKR